MQEVEGSAYQVNLFSLMFPKRSTQKQRRDDRRAAKNVKTA